MIVCRIMKFFRREKTDNDNDVQAPEIITGWGGKE